MLIPSKFTLKLVTRAGVLKRLSLLIMALVAVSVPVCAVDMETLSRATAIGSESCMECHEGFGLSENAGFHALSSGNTKGIGCEACHGPGSVHQETEDPANIITPDDKALMQSKCISCHRDTINGWKGHKIHTAEMNCLDCHAIHQPIKKGVLKKEEPELCYSCHNPIKAKFHMPSHHPMGKGKLLCSSCHDMTGKEFLKKERVNDQCLSCHAQYRGPFVFEHAPVVEDCLICHDPHGSVADNMLKQNEPFICLSCHQMHFHTQLSGYEGSFASPQIPSHTGTSHRRSFKQAMLTKCTQCHPMVHGSDLPSQTISGQGKALTR